MDSLNDRRSVAENKIHYISATIASMISDMSAMGVFKTCPLDIQSRIESKVDEYTKACFERYIIVVEATDRDNQ